MSLKVTTAATALAATALLLSVPASAPAAPTYCSPSGDFCLGAVKRGGVRYLTLDTFAFNGRVQVCVTTPKRRQQCRHFRLRRNHGMWSMKARWSKHFRNDGAGTYSAHFRLSGLTLGKPVTFRVGG